MQDQQANQNQGSVDTINQPQQVPSETQTAQSTQAQPIDNQKQKDGQVSHAREVVYGGYLKRSFALLIDGLILSPVNFILNIFLNTNQSALIGNFSHQTNGLDPLSIANIGEPGLYQGTQSIDQLMLLSSAAVVVGLISLVINIVYHTTFIALKGATPGKMALGLVVVNTEHGKLTLTKAILRETIGKFISGFVIGLGYLWVIWDDKKQGWHDKIAGTIVLEKKSLPQQQ